MTHSVRKLAIAALVCVWLGLLLGLLGRSAWPFDLFANFRLQYFALFLLLGIGLAFSSRKLYALAALAGAVVAAIPLVGYVAPGAPAEARPATFRLVTFPLSVPAILASIVIIALPMFGDYYTPDLLSQSPNTSMIGNQINLYIRGGQQIPVGAALVVCLMIFLTLLLGYYLVATARAQRKVGA